MATKNRPNRGPFGPVVFLPLEADALLRFRLPTRRHSLTALERSTSAAESRPEVSISRSGDNRPRPAPVRRMPARSDARHRFRRCHRHPRPAARTVATHPAVGADAAAVQRRARGRRATAAGADAQCLPDPGGVLRDEAGARGADPGPAGRRRTQELCLRCASRALDRVGAAVRRRGRPAATAAADQQRDGAVHRLPAGFLHAGRARRGRRAGVLPVDRRVQPDGHRAVLGLCQRPVYAGRGQAAVRGDRLRRVGRRRDGRVAVGPADPHHRRARAAAGCRRRAGAQPGAVQFHRPTRQSAAPGRSRGR